MQHGFAQLSRNRPVGERDRTAIGKPEGANIERIGSAMLGELRADDTVATADSNESKFRDR
jgi:hypothetical protein